MSETSSIKVQIAGRTYPLTVSNTEVERIRTAEKAIEETIMSNLNAFLLSMEGKFLFAGRQVKLVLNEKERVDKQNLLNAQRSQPLNFDFTFAP